jgi:hypothetical protein
MAAMVLLMPYLMLVAAVAVRAQQAQLQQIRTAPTVEMVRLHPFLAYPQRMREAAAVQPEVLAQVRGQEEPEVVEQVERGQHQHPAPQEQSTRAAAAGVATTPTAVLAAPASSSSSTPYPYSLS